MLSESTKWKIRIDMEAARRAKEVMLQNALQAGSARFEEVCLKKALEWEEMENYFAGRLASG